MRNPNISSQKQKVSVSFNKHNNFNNIFCLLIILLMAHRNQPTTLLKTFSHNFLFVKILRNKAYAVTHHLGAESPTAESKLKSKPSSKAKGKWLKITRRGLIVSALSRVGKRVRLSIVHSNYLSSAPRIFDIHPSIS